MIQKTFWRLMVFTLWAGSALSVAHAGPEATETVHQLECQATSGPHCSSE
jgi:hypothetical protein